MFTAGYLLAPDDAAETAVADFGSQYVLEKIKAPGMISIGAADEDNKPLPWKAWAGKIKAGGVDQVSVSYIFYEGKELAAHVAAAFAGTVSFVLQVETAGAVQTWFLRSENSPRNALSAAGFAGFIESQPNSPTILKRVHQLINESNHLNNKPLVPEGKTADFLRSPEGESIFDFLGDNLVSEIQIECKINDTSLLFSPEWDSYFQGPFGGSRYFTSTGDKDPVYFYSLRTVTADELKQVIAAQPFAEKIRPGVNRLIKEEQPPAFELVSDADGLLSSGSSDQLQILGNLICRVIISNCEESETLPIIPVSLSEAFGPDKTDQMRARARGHTDEFRSLKPPENPWRYYQYDRLPGLNHLITPNNAAAREKDFRESLGAISRFAEEKQLLSYVALFRLAAFLLSPSVATGTFGGESIGAAVKEQGFGEDIAKALADGIFYVSKMLVLDWPAGKCFGLLAVSITGVFGGMGSWNDQYFETDALEYDQVSAAFFRARQHYFASLLSGTASGSA